nr:solute carrier family 22 member 15-like [Penaeus vannamei]
MEVADPKWRTHIGIALFLPWALSLMAWGGFAYLVREWRMLQLTVSLLCLAFLPTLWFMDESPRWLAVRGQHRRASECCRGPPGGTGSPCPRGRASAPAQGRSQGRGNGTPTKTPAPTPREAGSEGTILILLLHHSPTPSHTLAPSPNRTPRLRTITLSLYTNYLLVGAVYFGLSLSGGDLSSDPFLYMVLTGVVELPAYTLVIPLVARYGRRAPVVAFFFMGAVALLALPFVPTGSGESMTLALMGKMSIASAFQILDFYSSELFPPSSVRGGVGARGLATLALPETLHVPLPDTIAHLEEREIRTRNCEPLSIVNINVTLSHGNVLH